MSFSNSSAAGAGSLACDCGIRAVLQTSKKEENFGRRFYGCRNWSRDGCLFFRWVDPPNNSGTSPAAAGLRTELKELSDRLDAMQQKLDKIGRKIKLVKLISTITWVLLLALLINMWKKL